MKGDRRYGLSVPFPGYLTSLVATHASNGHFHSRFSHAVHHVYLPDSKNNRRILGHKLDFINNLEQVSSSMLSSIRGYNSLGMTSFYDKKGYRSTRMAEINCSNEITWKDFDDKIKAIYCTLGNEIRKSIKERRE